MNIIYYALGSFLTLILVIVYRFFADNNRVVLDQNTLPNLIIISIIAGIAFFLADYIMSKK